MAHSQKVDAMTAPTADPKADPASDPEEDDLSDLDGWSHARLQSIFY